MNADQLTPTVRAIAFAPLPFDARPTKQAIGTVPDSPERVISRGYSRLLELAERLKRSPRFRVIGRFLMMNETAIGKRWLAWSAKQATGQFPCKCKRCQRLKAIWEANDY